MRSRHLTELPSVSEEAEAPEDITQPSHPEVETRAFELYQKRGGEDGRDLEDWLTAEEQLLEEHQLRLGI